MKQNQLDKEEIAIEQALIKGEYFNVDKTIFDEIAKAVAARKRDAVMNIRVNSQDLQNIKQKAKKLGVRYQTFISELLHRVAHS